MKYFPIQFKLIIFFSILKMGRTGTDQKDISPSSGYILCFSHTCPKGEQTFD